MQETEYRVGAERARRERQAFMLGAESGMVEARGYGRFAFENGEVGYFNGERFSYYRPGDGYRYWSYWNGDPEKLVEIVAFNRARESGQLRLPLGDESLFGEG